MPGSHRDCIPSSRRNAVAGSEAQDQGQGIVHGSKLVCVEASGGMPETLWIDDDCLLDYHASLGALQADGRPKRGRACAGRGRRNEGRAQRHELVGLNDDRVAGAVLLPPAHTSWRRQSKDLAPNHVNRSIWARARPSARG